MILTLNAGSSSLKFALFEDETPRLRGRVEIGAPGRRVVEDGAGVRLSDAAVEAPDAAAALRATLGAVAEAAPGADVAAVGHRVVHGGTGFVEPVRVDDSALEALEALVPFAPLHQPHNLAAIRRAREAFPQALQVACFDTAFHRRQPFEADAYALPRALHAQGIRRYGFHGLSYEFVGDEMAREAPGAERVVIAHLGAGASMCGLLRGRPMGSTMGFTALDGLPMATRCGQLDPGVLLKLMADGMDAEALSTLLYKRSGLLGLSGLSGDMRDLLASDAAEAAEAVAYFAARCRREIGALAATLGGLDLLAFCGGVGENAAPVRAAICEGMDWLGLALDPERNRANASDIGAGRVAVRVAPTDEERVIARAARRLLAPESTTVPPGDPAI